MRYLNKILSFYIHSSIHVALGATAYAFFTYLASGTSKNTDYLLFVFSSTMLLYAIHKIIGRKQVMEFDYFARVHFSIYNRYLFIIIIILSSISSVYFYLLLPINYKFLMLIPAFISLLYTLPIFNGKRLRDFAYIKIFLIAISWSMVCNYLPLLDSDLSQFYRLLWTISSALFVFAITLPFDIRDFEIDKRVGTETIPIRVGILPTLKLAKFTLALSVLIFMILLKQELIDLVGFIAILISSIVGVLLIVRTRPNSFDNYVSGLIEGLLILPLAMYFLLRIW